MFKMRSWQADRWFQKGNVEFVAGLPMDDRTLRLPGTFGKTTSQGRQMELHITGFSDKNFWEQANTANSDVLEVFRPFRRFHTVKLFVKLYRNEYTSVALAVSRDLSRKSAHRLRFFRSTLRQVLGPETNVVTGDLDCVYSDYTVYHPRSHFEANQRQTEGQNTSE